MAKKLKKIFALMMVMCMLISMLPVQALAEEADASIPEDIEVTVTADEETNEIVVEIMPSDEVAPASEETVVEETVVEEAVVAAEEETENPDSVMEDVLVKIEVDESNNVNVEYASPESAPITEEPLAGEAEWESELTQGEGITTEVTDIVVKEEVLEDGTEITTEEITVETEGTLEDGAKIEGEETYTEITTETEEVTQIEGVVEGEETITEEQDIIDVLTKPEEDGVSVDVPLEVGSNSAEGEEKGTVIEGEKPEQLPAEGDYEYEWTEVVEQGSVTITTEKIEITETVEDRLVDENGNVTEGSDLDYLVGEVNPGIGEEDNGLFVWVFRGGRVEIPESFKDIEMKEGFDYKYLGQDVTSQYMPAFMFKSPDPSNPDQEPCYIDENGQKYYLRQYNGVNYDSIYEDGERKEANGDMQAAFSVPQQFLMVDAATGELITTYCADAQTSTQQGFYYNIENLEDAEYYSPEEAAHIRAIAQNGYWATVGTETDEEGNEVAKFGSLDAMKASLLASGEFTEAELALLNDGLALSATQMAIWSYSNKMSDMVFVNAMLAKDPDANGELKTSWASQLVMSGGPSTYTEEQKTEIDVMFKLYDYLINLQPENIENPTTTNTIINADNFVDNVNVTVIEKAEDHENNKDERDDNDAYVTNLTFALVVAPSTENGDDLVVQVVDANGKVIASGRVAGELQEGESWAKHYGDNNYGFENIVMTEGDQTFSLSLKGIQNLKEGVYLYTSEVREEEGTSQTMVGIASGKRAVNVSMDITFNLDVKDQVVATERVWRKAKDPVEVREPRARYRYNAPETIIEEEPVPLADVPQTGDNSVVWFAMIVLAAAGLFVINASEKKCKA